MIRSLKICMAALLAVMMTFPALAWAAPNVTTTFQKESKNVAYVYLHGLADSHTVRVDLVAKDSSGNLLSWNGANSAATFQMASWLKDAASVAENTYTGSEMVVVLSHGNYALPTNAENTPDNYFIGTITTTGDDPIYVGITEIQVQGSTGSTPDVITPGVGEDYLASVEMNTDKEPDDDPGFNPGSGNDAQNGSSSNPGGNTGNDGNNGSGGSNNGGGSNGGNPSKTTGGDLAKTGDDADLIIGGLLIAVAVAGSVVVITAVSRKTRSSNHRE